MNTGQEFTQVPKTFNDWREARRFRGWELHEKGWGPTRIAEALGITSGAVCQWIKAVEEGGLKALLSSTTKRGSKPKLLLEELKRLPEFLERGPEAYGFRGEVWTRSRVRKVIKEEFGVSYSVRHVGRLLRKVGWTRQKPVERADQRDEEEIADWHAETFPNLKKKPHERDER